LEVWRVACFDELAEKGGIAYSFEDFEEKLERPRGPAES